MITVYWETIKTWHLLLGFYFYLNLSLNNNMIIFMVLICLLLLLLSHFSCVWLCYPIDGSPPGSSVPEILQTRTLEWVAISFSNAWKWKVKVKSLSRVQLFSANFAHNVLCLYDIMLLRYTKIFPSTHLPLFSNVRPSKKFYWDWTFLISTPSKQKSNKKHWLRIQKPVVESMFYHFGNWMNVGSYVICLSLRYFFFMNNCNYNTTLERGKHTTLWGDNL